jgi:regulator of nucleoside diphosphate kinase
MSSQKMTDHASHLVLPEEDYLRLRRLAGQHPLADELDRVVVVSPERMPNNVVTMNSRCTYFDESARVRREVELVYPEDADPASGKVSVLAPVGSALLGMAVGQSIDWDFPDGRAHRLHIERVTRVA